MYTVQDIKKLRDMTGAGMLDSKTALEKTDGNIDAAVDYLREKGIATAAKKESRIAAEGLTKVVTNQNSAVIVEINSETDFVAKNATFISAVEELANALLNSDVTTYEDALNVKVDGVSISDYIINLTSKIGEKISFRRFEKLTKTDNQVFGSYLHMGGKIGVLTLLEGSNEEVAKEIAMHAAAMNPKYLNRDAVSKEEIAHEEAIIKEQAINEGKPADIAEKMVAGRINKFFKEITLEEQPYIKDDSMNVKTFAKNNDSKVISYIRFEVGEGIEKRNEDFASEVMQQING